MYFRYLFIFRHVKQCVCVIQFIFPGSRCRRRVKVIKVRLASSQIRCFIRTQTSLVWQPGEIGAMQTLGKQQSYIPFKLSFQFLRRRRQRHNNAAGGFLFSRNFSVTAARASASTTVERERVRLGDDRARGRGGGLDAGGRPVTK